MILFLYAPLIFEIHFNCYLRCAINFWMLQGGYEETEGRLFVKLSPHDDYQTSVRNANSEEIDPRSPRREFFPDSMIEKEGRCWGCWISCRFLFETVRSFLKQNFDLLQIPGKGLDAPGVSSKNRSWINSTLLLPKTHPTDPRTLASALLWYFFPHDTSPPMGSVLLRLLQGYSSFVGHFMF